MAKAKRNRSRSMERPEPSSQERLAWLLSILGRDVEALRPGDWLNLRHDVQHYLWPAMDLGVPEFNEAVRKWHQEARRGLEALGRDRSWTLDRPINRTLVRLQQQRSGSLLTVYERPSLSDALMASTVDLIGAWYPQLRRCRQCQAWFLPRHGRQWFHDPACSVRARWERYAPKRKRDYHAEYSRRVRRAAPGAKPQRRPRMIGEVGR